MDNKERIKYFYENVTSNNLLDEVDEYVSDDCTIRIGEKIIPAGIIGMKQHLIDVRKTYPDLKVTIICQYCDGDYVISEFIVEGTHKGEWLGMKPTGKKLIFTGVDIDKVENGKIIEHGGATNTFETLFEAEIIQPA
ncbi:ester cyclase [Oscillospiraceae bacterium PP1C4]